MVRFEDEVYVPNDGSGNAITIKNCVDWGGTSPRPCFDNKPAVTIKWVNCGMGSSPGGKQPGHGATACSGFSSGPDDFTCLWGQNCFAVTARKKKDVIWGNPYTGCDGDGNKITIQKCDGWSDPEECKKSITNPSDYFDNPVRPSSAVTWAKCGIGSSPGKLVPGTLGVCSPFSDGCALGQDCFAVTKNDASLECPIDFLTNPGGFIKQYLMFFVIGCVICIFVGIMLCCICYFL
jgi:hypothetical protein